MPNQKRLSKEELTQDEFTASVFKFIGYAEQNYPKLIAGAGAVVVLVLIGVFIADSANKKAQAGIDAIGDVQVSLMQGNTSSAITKAQAIARDYSGEEIAGRAVITLANIYYDQGRFDEATAQYRKFLSDVSDESGPQGYGANAGIAASMEAQGNTAGAAQQHETYANSYGNTPYAPLALLEAGRCYISAGNLAQAKVVFERIRKDYASSTQARVAQTELEILGEVIN